MRKALLWGGVFVACVVLAAVLYRFPFDGRGAKHPREGAGPSRSAVTVLAFGDVNLGRLVGQKILANDVQYPFERISLSKGSVNVVFANLESQLSSQHGETQDPRHNMIFTGPPNGALSLRRFGFTLVSTANNHAYDYGKRALFETLDHLDESSIVHVGTTRGVGELYEPIMFEKNGIRFAFFATSDFMNFAGGWHDYVAMTDTSKLFPALREAAAAVDVVVVSVHGGDEYADEPTLHIREFDEACVRQGARIVIGHHPHVPYGVEKVGSSYIFHSLGNFVFYQPQHFWTQLSYAVELKFEREGSGVSVTSVGFIPLKAGYQPSVLKDSAQVAQLRERVQSISNIPITMTTKDYLR
ncbi:MAG TPA: CapA family protein [Bacteroidota bacterium]|nr:CapA family protein [Bacteroidota bacterium]